MTLAINNCKICFSYTGRIVENCQGGSSAFVQNVIFNIQDVWQINETKLADYFDVRRTAGASSHLNWLCLILSNDLIGSLRLLIYRPNSECVLSARA